LWLSIELPIRLSGFVGKAAAWWPVSVRIEWRSGHRSRPSPRLIDGGPEPGWRRFGISEIDEVAFRSRAWDAAAARDGEAGRPSWER